MEPRRNRTKKTRKTWRRGEDGKSRGD